MMKRALILGSGLVSRPLIGYLLEQPDILVLVASRTLSKAKRVVGSHPRARSIQLDVNDTQRLESLIDECDLAVSLLPYAYHARVAKLCVSAGKHLVTTSYVQKHVADFDGAAQRAGVLLLNEVGLDPGIDHMSAMRVIARAQKAGGRIIQFSSYCGGLPAPEANTNPLGYKFSWSPRGVLLAAKNSARFLRDGSVIDIPGPELFDHHWIVSIEGVGDLEGYPNRDSLPYQELYGIEGASGVFRGTLRNPGWCSTLKQLVRLGLLDDHEVGCLEGLTWAGLLAQRVGSRNHSPIREKVAEFLGLGDAAQEMEAMAWLGLFTEGPLATGATTPLDALVAQMQHKMAFVPGERDMVVLRHDFVVDYGGHCEHIASTLVDYGIPWGDSAMSRTVGLPAAIASCLILRGQIKLTGVRVPVCPEIYEPILDELEGRGIVCLETRTRFC